MKPITAALPIANWIFRGSILIYLLLLYFDKIVVVNFKNFGDVMYFVYVLSGLLLFIGGFLSKPTLSIITGVLLFLCTIYFMVTHLPADFTRIQISSFLVYLWPAGIGLYFAGSGG
jgi:hypothetical protein